MFGYLRFLLAFLVLLSHVDVKFYGLNPGVIAVVMFYMLAGYVVSHLWENIIPHGRGKLYRFYKDRVLRVLPLYSYVAVLTLIFLAITGYADPKFSLLRLAANFLIIPLNYYMVADTIILTSPGWCLIPPAWSLGAELQAYILLPLALVNKKLKILLAAVSFGVYMLANLSVINPDYFGYRLIFGVFFIFVAGSSIQISNNSKTSPAQKRSQFGFDTLYPPLLWGFIACLGLIFTSQNLFSPAYTRETFIGILIGIPLICLFSRSKIKLPKNSFLGSLSYGVFLSHFIVIWYLDHTGLINKNSMAYIPVVTMGAILIAWSGVKFIETGIDKLRKV
jgi:peptidoglycan/LPS O-acetylase OafA/YrhL